MKQRKAPKEPAQQKFKKMQLEPVKKIEENQIIYRNRIKTQRNLLGQENQRRVL